MKKITDLKPFLSSSEANDIEFNKIYYHNNSSLNKDKIYFFRTSLFTEKSKNFIQKMNSCHKKISKNNEFNEIITPEIKGDSRISFHKQKESNDKQISLEDKNKIKKINEMKKDSSQSNKNNNIKQTKIKERIEDNNNNVNNKPIINDNIGQIDKIKNQATSKSTNNLINILTNNKNNKYQVKNDNKSKTEVKKENNIYNENLQKINYKIISNIKKCKLFSSLPNVIENINRNISKINNRSILGNYAFKSQSTNDAHLSNQKPELNRLSQKKHIKMPENNKKVKYKLKSIKSQNKENDNNNNIVSIKSICDNNTMKKEIKYYKSISKHCNFQSFSIFEENYNITRYKLGKYLAKRNNRYQKNNVISEDKTKTKRYLKSGSNRYNIVA